MRTKVFLVFATLSIFCIALSAHPGRLDRNGGHKGPGGYHYHSGGGSGGSNFSNQKKESKKNQSKNAVVAQPKIFILADKSEKLYHYAFCKTIKGKEVAQVPRDWANSDYKACTICKPVLLR